MRHVTARGVKRAVVVVTLAIGLLGTSASSGMALADDATGPVVPIPDTLWVPAAGSVPATGNYVYLDSDAGDYIGRGYEYLYTPADSVLSVSASGGHLSVDIDGDDWWNGDFQAMASLAELEMGYYPDLQRYPFHNPAKGGLNWSGEGRGSNTLTGWFAIDSVTYTNGALSSIDLRFEQHSEGGTPALHGAIHWEADGDIAPPVTTVTVTPSTPDGAGDCYKTAPKITLASNEPADAYWRWDADAYSAYATTLTAPEGSHTLSFYSVDSAGNTETARSLSFRVDSAAPVTMLVAALPTPTLAGGWYRTAPKIALRPDESGVTYCRWDSAPYATYTTTLTAPVGAHTLSFYSVDGAGNTEAVQARTFKVARRPSLGRPVVPALVRRGRYFTTYGYVAPRVGGMTKVCFYRMVDGCWVPSRHAYTPNRHVSSTSSKYTLRYRVPFSGRWCVRACFPGATGVLAGWSTARAFAVR